MELFGRPPQISTIQTVILRVTNSILQLGAACEQFNTATYDARMVDMQVKIM